MENKNNATLRLFVAVEMPAEVVVRILAVQQYLKERNVFEGTYTTPAGMHVTLKFLGEVNVTSVAQINGALTEIYHSRLQAKLGPLDVFIARGRITIIYMRLICHDMEKLANKIDMALAPQFAQETRPFVSHITIARVKSVASDKKLLGVLYGITIEPTIFTLHEFVLKESVLTPEGSMYTDVARYPLL